MDILANYYNAAGQIINRVPDLKSREFYRDYMCRHMFNEMFVAGQERNKIGAYYNSDGVATIFGAGTDCEPTTILGGSEIIVSSGGTTTVQFDPRYGFVKDSDGIECVRVEIAPPFLDETNRCGVMSSYNYTLPSVVTAVEIGMIFSSPVGILPNGTSELIIASYSQIEEDTYGTYADIGMHFEDATSSGPMIFTEINDEDGQSYSCLTTWDLWHPNYQYDSLEGIPSFVQDGSKNIVSCRIMSKGMSIFVNGTKILEKENCYSLFNSRNKPCTFSAGIWRDGDYGTEVAVNSQSRIYSAYMKILA